jgi:hypothetical protein
VEPTRLALQSSLCRLTPSTGLENKTGMGTEEVTVVCPVVLVYCMHYYVTRFGNSTLSPHHARTGRRGGARTRAASPRPRHSRRAARPVGSAERAPIPFSNPTAVALCTLEIES